MRRGILGAGSAIGGLLAGYLVLIGFPQPFFPYKVARANATLYSDGPLPSGASAYLDQALARLSRSPWADPALPHRIFICQARWRWVLFSSYRHNAGGVNLAYLNRNL